jgi:hypothetical protein
MTDDEKARLRRMTPTQRLALWRRKRAHQNAAAAGLLRLVEAAKSGTELDDELGTLLKRTLLFGGIGSDHGREVRRAIAARRRRVGVLVKEVAT